MNDNYIHPLDSKLSSQILNSKIGQIFLKTVFSNNLDEVNSYLYSTSNLALGADTKEYQYMIEGCKFFGLEHCPKIYVIRSYDYQIICTGMNEPIICIPDVLLQRNDQEILRGRIMATVAAIKAGHNKLTFFSWVYDNFKGLLPIPILDTAIRTARNEWYRAQFYTLDRAFYFATNDRNLTLKNVLYGETSFEILDNLSFGERDSFTHQINEFHDLHDAAGIVSLVHSYLQEESWLPERYDLIRKFMNERD